MKQSPGATPPLLLLRVCFRSAEEQAFHITDHLPQESQELAEMASIPTHRGDPLKYMINHYSSGQEGSQSHNDSSIFSGLISRRRCDWKTGQGSLPLHSCIIKATYCLRRKAKDHFPAFKSLGGSVLGPPKITM